MKDAACLGSRNAIDSANIALPTPLLEGFSCLMPVVLFPHHTQGLVDTEVSFLPLSLELASVSFDFSEGVIPELIWIVRRWIISGASVHLPLLERDYHYTH